MANRLTANVLGCLILSFAISACGGPQPRPLEISAKPIDKPELVLPQSDTLRTRDVKWVVITPENFQEVYDKMAANGKPLVLFALTDEGYEALSLNLSDLRAFIQQQQAIIVAYEGYYKDSNSALDAANAEIQGAVDEVNNAPQETKKGILGIF